MVQPRVFLDCCVLIEGLLSPWSHSRGVLLLGRSVPFAFVLAEIVIEETERALLSKLGSAYGGGERLREDYRFLLRRLVVERIPHVSREEAAAARAMIRHANDAPVLVAWRCHAGNGLGAQTSELFHQPKTTPSLKNPA